MALEIAYKFPNKRITLVHSRDYLFPEVSENTTRPHEYALNAMKSRGITVILRERVEGFERISPNERSRFPGIELGPKNLEELDRFGVFRTSAEKEIQADIAYLCTNYVCQTSISCTFALLVHRSYVIRKQTQSGRKTKASSSRRIRDIDMMLHLLCYYRAQKTYLLVEI